MSDNPQAEYEREKDHWDEMCEEASQDVTSALCQMADYHNEGSVEDVTLRFAADYIKLLRQRLATAESVIEHGIPKEERLIELEQRLAAAEALWAAAISAEGSDWADEIKEAAEFLGEFHPPKGDSR